MKIIFQTDNGKLYCDRYIEGLSGKDACHLMFSAIESLGTHDFCASCDQAFLKENLVNVDGSIECKECYDETIDSM